MGLAVLTSRLVGASKCLPDEYGPGLGRRTESRSVVAIWRLAKLRPQLFMRPSR